MDLRIIRYGADARPRKATVQITLKPILSFRHARNRVRMFGRDLRTGLIRRVQEDLDEGGLGHYVARPGGLSSVDVTLEKLDKAYALQFLIDRLNLQGYARYRQKCGSNAIYIGDEVVVGGGNDYPVTRIPGLLVFAVDFERELIPALSHVFVPSAILVGPDAAAEVIARYNGCAKRLLGKFDQHATKKKPLPRTALETFKEELFIEQIRERISNLTNSGNTSVEDWRTLHAFVTLMCRRDPAGRQWLAILLDELDAIMAEVAAGAPRRRASLIQATRA